MLKAVCWLRRRPVLAFSTSTTPNWLSLHPNVRAGYHSLPPFHTRARRSSSFSGGTFRKVKSDNDFPLIRDVGSYNKRSPKLLASRRLLEDVWAKRSENDPSLTAALVLKNKKGRIFRSLAPPENGIVGGAQNTQASSQTLQLLDLKAVRQQASLWKDIFFYRQRRYGSQGAREVWDKFRSFHVQELPNIYGESELWKAIVILALKDPNLRKSLVDYIQEVFAHSGWKPPRPSNLYLSIIKCALEEGLHESLSYHDRLKFLEPARSQLGEFIIALADDPRAEVFREFCNDIPSFRDMYGRIVPALCDSKGFEIAYSWHIFLINHGHAANYRHLARLRQCYVDSNPKFKPLRAGKDYDAPSSKKLQVLDSKDAEVKDLWTLLQTLEQQIRFRNITRKTLSDETCARFFATRFFSIDSVISGLRLISVEIIGPLSIRTLLNRIVRDDTCDVEVARGYLKKLDEASISLDGSMFCTAVKNLILQGNSQILHDVVTSDLHSDAFEDFNLQEELLAQYVATNDHRQLNRTLAILTTNTSSDRTRDIQVRNLLLRAAIQRKDESTMHQIIGQMRDTHSPVTHRTRQHMVQKLVLTASRPGVVMVTRPELLKVIRIFQWLAASGTVIDPFEWRGLLHLCRRSPYPNMYEVYVELLEWLSLHYPSGEVKSTSGSHRVYVDGHPKRIVKGPAFWAILYPGKELWEFLRWSMDVAVKQPESFQLLKGKELRERVEELASHRILQGVRQLAKLKNLGIPFREERVNMACQARLKFMYSLNPGKWLIRKRLKRFRALASLGEYVIAIESIWGGNVFCRKVSIAEFEETILPLEQRMTAPVDRYFPYFRPATDSEALSGEVDNSSDNLSEENFKQEVTDEDGSMEQWSAEEGDEAPPEFEDIYGLRRGIDFTDVEKERPGSQGVEGEAADGENEHDEIERILKISTPDKDWSMVRERIDSDEDSKY